MFEENEPMVCLEKKVSSTMLKINEFNANKTHRPKSISTCSTWCKQSVCYYTNTNLVLVLC